MASLGYIVDTIATGEYNIKMENRRDIENGEFMSFPTYSNT